MILGCVAAVVALGGPSVAQDLSTAYIQQARALTDTRFMATFERQCAAAPPRIAILGNGVPMEPVRLFDNFHYVGRTDVGAWVLATSDGLILFDTLYTPQEAEQVIVEGMRKLGLDPASLRYVVLSHAHRDHSGGVSYFRDRGVRVLASAADWRAIGGAPDAESIIYDGQKLTLGHTTVTLVLTPGHTEGTITALFPVMDGAKPHMAVWMGGIGPRGGLEEHRVSVAGLEHLRTFTAPAGVDVIFHPHPHIDDSLQYLEAMRARQPGDANPFVMGADVVQRFSDMVTTCWKADIARMQQDLAAAAPGESTQQRK